MKPYLRFAVKGYAEMYFATHFFYKSLKGKGSLSSIIPFPGVGQNKEVQLIFQGIQFRSDCFDAKRPHCSTVCFQFLISTCKRTLKPFDFLLKGLLLDEVKPTYKLQF